MRRLGTPVGRGPLYAVREALAPSELVWWKSLSQTGRWWNQRAALQSCRSLRVRIKQYHPPPAAMTSLPKRLAQEVVRISWTSLARVFIGPEVSNPPDWKKLGGAILAPNHNSYLDPVVVQTAIPHPVRFMMTEGIYRIPAMRWFFKLWDTIPVPDGDAVKVSAMKEALRVVRGGKPLVIFPEGGISQNGRLQPGQPGVVALMMRARVPVIPVAILGTYEVLPYRANFVRAGRVKVRFGEPILPPPELERDGVRAYAARIMDAIHALGAPR